jgi:ATP-dependent Clp protease ATP-binding subunit ClpA
VSITSEAIEFIAKSEYSIEMGARPLKRYIQDNITNKLSDEILFGKLRNGGTVSVDFKEKLLLNFEQKSADTTTK